MRHITLLQFCKFLGIPVLEVDSNWKTPATSYPLRKVGKAKITRVKYRRGIYWMEGVGGYVYFFVKDEIPVTTLKIGRSTWMVDDPMHWIGMQLLAKASKGRVLCVGLGLGLIVHALHQEGVRDITVIEISRDVIELIKPLIPKCEIINDDYYKYMEREHEELKKYDTIILDIWTGRDDSNLLLSMLCTYYRTLNYAPKSKVYVWGIKNTRLNPAYKTIKHNKHTVRRNNYEV